MQMCNKLGVGLSFKDYVNRGNPIGHGKMLERDFVGPEALPCVKRDV